MTTHFDGVIWQSYTSVHIIDKVQLADLVIKYVMTYQQVSVGISSNLCVEKRAKEQLNLSSQVLRKIGSSSDFQFIQSRKS